MAKRRKSTDQFKARVALEALRGDKAVQEIAARHQRHPNQVSTWKRQAIDGMGSVALALIRHMGLVMPSVMRLPGTICRRMQFRCELRACRFQSGPFRSPEMFRYL